MKDFDLYQATKPHIIDRSRSEKVYREIPMETETRSDKNWGNIPPVNRSLDVDWTTC